MTITLKPSTEAMLLQKAQKEGQDPDALANEVLLAFLAANAQDTTGEDPRMAILREIDLRSQFMNPKPSGRDFLREGRDGGMFGEKPA